MLIYLLLIIILSLLTLLFSFREPPRFLIKLFFIILFLLASLRSINVGNDTPVYYRLFTEIESLGEVVLSNGRFEIGYIYLNYFFRFWSNNFVLYLFTVNSFIYFVYYKFICKYSSNKFLSLYLFLTLGFWGSTVNILRVEIALSFVLLSYMIFDGKIKLKAILVWLMSLLFHRISLFSFILFLIPSQLSKKFYYISFLALIIVTLLFNKFVNLFVRLFPYFGVYLHNNYSNGGGTLAITVYLLIHLFIIFLYLVTTRHKNVSENSRRYFSIIYLSLLCTILAYQFNLIDRIAHFFWVFVLIFIPELLSYVKDKRSYVLLLIGIMLFSFIFFIVRYVLKAEWNRIIPYEFFWGYN